MDTGFIRRFIKNEMYLQNPPLETTEFIKFCKDRGIKTTEKELELFEKERLFFPLIRGPPAISSFADNKRDEILVLLEEGKIFYPADKPFQPWSTFVGEKLEWKNKKVMSFFSSFQVFWLEKLIKSYSFKIKPYGEKTLLLSPFCCSR